jgi:transcriptional regulator with XRE-family HTH domain
VSVGRAIRLARKQARMSQYVLARKIGWRNRSQVSRVETGDRDLGIRELAAIALALGISPHELLRAALDELSASY